MTLIYADGSKTEAFLLSRKKNKIRVAIPGCEDPIEFTDVHGTWVSEDCEPVRVEFAWQGKTREELLSESDCICSHELAARLIHLLWSCEDDQVKTSGLVKADDCLGMPSANRGN